MPDPANCWRGCTARRRVRAALALPPARFALQGHCRTGGRETLPFFQIPPKNKRCPATDSHCELCTYADWWSSCVTSLTNRHKRERHKAVATAGDNDPGAIPGKQRHVSAGRGAHPLHRLSMSRQAIAEAFFRHKGCARRDCKCHGGSFHCWRADAYL